MLEMVSKVLDVVAAVVVESTGWCTELSEVETKELDSEREEEEVVS